MHVHVDVCLLSQLPRWTLPYCIVITVLVYFLADSQPLLQFLLNNLNNKKLAVVAANSLRKICEQCASKLTSHFHLLLHIARSIDSFSLSQEASIGLLRGESLRHSNVTRCALNFRSESRGKLREDRSCSLWRVVFVYSVIGNSRQRQWRDASTPMHWDYESTRRFTCTNVHTWLY